jgi:hypothetical protein
LQQPWLWFATATVDGWVMGADKKGVNTATGYGDNVAKPLM